MRKIKAKPLKIPKLKRDTVFVEVPSRLAAYLLCQEQYEKYCFHKMGRIILANLRGVPFEDDYYV